MTPAGGSNSTGSNGKDDEERIVRLVEEATKLAVSGNHRFLAYLLDMARMEASRLARTAKR